MTLQKPQYSIFQACWSVKAFDDTPAQLQIRSFTSQSYRAIKEREHKKEQWRRDKVKRSSDGVNRGRWRSQLVTDNAVTRSAVRFEGEDDILKPQTDSSLLSVRGSGEAQSELYELDCLITPSTALWASRSAEKIGHVRAPEADAALSHSHSRGPTAQEAGESASVVTTRRPERSGCGFSTDGSDLYLSHDSETVVKRCGDGLHENNISGSILSCSSPRRSTAAEPNSDMSVDYVRTDEDTRGSSLPLEPNSEHWLGDTNRHQWFNTQTNETSDQPSHPAAVPQMLAPYIPVSEVETPPRSTAFREEQTLVVDQWTAEFNNYPKGRLVLSDVEAESVFRGRPTCEDEPSASLPTAPISIDASSSKTGVEHDRRRAAERVPGHDVHCGDDSDSANGGYTITNRDDMEISPSLQPLNHTSDAAMTGLMFDCLSTKPTVHSNVVTTAVDGKNGVTDLAGTVPRLPGEKLQLGRSTRCRAMPPDLWTRGQDELLLHLRNTAQLTWENLLSYFPGTVLNAVKSRYQYLGQCGVDGPVIDYESKALGRKHTGTVAIACKGVRSVRIPSTKSPHRQKATRAVACKGVSRQRHTSKQMHSVTDGRALKSLTPDESPRTSRSGRPIRHPFRNRPKEGYM